MLRLPSFFESASLERNKGVSYHIICVLRIVCSFRSVGESIPFDVLNPEIVWGSTVHLASLRKLQTKLALTLVHSFGFLASCERFSGGCFRARSPITVTPDTTHREQSPGAHPAATAPRSGAGPPRLRARADPSSGAGLPRPVAGPPPPEAEEKSKATGPNPGENTHKNKNTALGGWAEEIRQKIQGYQKRKCGLFSHDSTNLPMKSTWRGQS